MHHTYCLRILLATIAVVTISVVAQADIPQMISYQGKVTDSGGIPVADGNYNMTFRIYDAETGGTEEWNSGGTPLSVAVSGGVFSVLLGESSPITLSFDEDYWLEVDIEGDIQLPRQRLGSVGYAYMASGLVPGTAVVGEVTSMPFAAVTASNTATSGNTYGIHGHSASTIGRAVFGENSATSGNAYGVFGQTVSTSGRAVYGLASAPSGVTFGFYGQCASANGRGVYGEVTATSGVNFGVYGTSESTGGTGVYGVASSTTGVNYGVYGKTNSAFGYGVYGENTGGWAGYFDGDTSIDGNLTITGNIIGPTFGDITAVTAGMGLDGGGASGDVTLDVSVPLTLSASSPGYIVSGTNTGGGNGVFGEVSATTGRGVYGNAAASTGTNYGVYGRSQSTAGIGVYGLTSTTEGGTYGVYGRSASDSGRGVYGYAPSSTGTTHGVQGRSASTAGRGVSGRATSTTGTAFGVYGQSASDEGRGVYGFASSTEGTNYGVYGICVSSDGYGVYGENSAGFAGHFEGDTRVDGDLIVTGTISSPGVGDITAVHAGTGLGGGGTSGDVTLNVNVPLTLTDYTADGEWIAKCKNTGYGEAIVGEVVSSNAKAVYGYSASTTGSTYGVYGETESESGCGVYGGAFASSGTNYGIRAFSNSASGYAGYFHGDVHVSGTLSKSAGSFLIDHPADPENKLLRHNFVESPGNLLIYRGRARLDGNGEAVVRLPHYFDALVREDEATVTLTPIGRPFLFGYEMEPDNTSFRIYGESDREVSWVVYADRDDPVIRKLAKPVEEDKGPDNKYCDRGKLLYPEAYGYPETMGRDYMHVEGTEE